jgi:hypothetical protein
MQRWNILDPVFKELNQDFKMDRIGYFYIIAKVMEF